MKTLSLIAWMAVGGFAGFHLGSWYSERMHDRAKRPGVVVTVTEQREMDTMPILCLIGGALAPLYFRSKEDKYNN